MADYKTKEEQIEEMRELMIESGLAVWDREAVPDFDEGPFPGLIAYDPSYRGIHTEKGFPRWVHVAWEDDRIDVNIVLSGDELAGGGAWFEIPSATSFDAAKKIVRLFALSCRQPMQLRPGDEVTIKILSDIFTASQMRLWRGDEEVERPDGGNDYTLPVNTEEGVSLIMKILSDFCGLQTEEVESEEDIIRYQFTVPKVKIASS